jgi:hypothetical protein
MARDRELDGAACSTSRDRVLNSMTCSDGA